MVCLATMMMLFPSTFTSNSSGLKQLEISFFGSSKDHKVFLEKAEDLGKKLQRAYDTKSGLPHGSVNLNTGSSHNFGWYGGNYILAEIGTQQIEYRYLSHATGNNVYATKSDRVFDILEEQQPADGLFGEGLQESGNSIHFTKDKGEKPYYHF